MKGLVLYNEGIGGGLALTSFWPAKVILKVYVPTMSGTKEVYAQAVGLEVNSPRFLVVPVGSVTSTLNTQLSPYIPFAVGDKGLSQKLTAKV